jgi:hypothetical protein
MKANLRGGLDSGGSGLADGAAETGGGGGADGAGGGGGADGAGGWGASGWVVARSAHAEKPVQGAGKESGSAAGPGPNPPAGTVSGADGRTGSG